MNAPLDIRRPAAASHSEPEIGNGPSSLKLVDLPAFGRFVKLPHAVLWSQAWLLARPTTQVLTVSMLAVGRNGQLVAVLDKLRDLGWNSNSTLRDALKQALDLDLLVVTRPGGRNRAILYGVPWLPGRNLPLPRLDVARLASPQTWALHSGSRHLPADADPNSPQSRSARDRELWEKFVMMPLDLLRSEAWQDAPPSTRSLLTLLPSLGRNGTFEATARILGEFGFGSDDTIQRAIHGALDRRLLVLTRKGGPNVAARYAAEWLPLADTSAFDIDPKLLLDRETWRQRFGQPAPALEPFQPGGRSRKRRNAAPEPGPTLLRDPAESTLTAPGSGPTTTPKAGPHLDSLVVSRIPSGTKDGTRQPWAWRPKH